MTAHGVAMATYRRMKSLPLVGKATRWSAGRLKTALASWHYSNNRLRRDLTEEASGGTGTVAGAAPTAAPDARIEQLSRRLARVEAALAGADGVGTASAVVRLRDREGLVSELTCHAGMDLGRFIPPSGLAELEVLDVVAGSDAESVIGELLPRLADHATEGTVLAWSCPPDMRRDGPDARRVAEAMALSGLTPIGTGSNGAVRAVRGTA